MSTITLPTVLECVWCRRLICQRPAECRTEISAMLARCTERSKITRCERLAR